MLGETQYNTGIPKYVYPYPAGLGETQYNTGIPKYVYPYPVSTGLGQSAGAVGAVTGLVGDLGRLGRDIFDSYNDKQIAKAKIKADQELALHQANLGHLGLEERLKVEEAIKRKELETQLEAGRISGGFGVQYASIFGIAAVLGLGIVSTAYVASRK